MDVPPQGQPATVELSADGETLRLRAGIDATEKKRLAAENGVKEEELEVFLSQDWHRAGPATESEEGLESRANAPDIGGMWHKAAEETDRFAIRPSRNGAGFVITSRDDNQPLEGNVEWSREKGRFEGTAMIPKNFKGPIPLVLVPEDDGKKMRVRFSLSEQQRKEMLKHWQEVAEKNPGVQQVDSLKEPEEALIASSHQVWVRDSVDSNPFPSGGPATHDPNNPHEAFANSVPRSPRQPVNAIPDTPGAKRLIEQLGAQESAAAAEAGTIRQLQANGQAEQNKQPIAQHQRKLKNLLSTAFDLKLQLEELQVKELQSRLSRLERQIGQRRGLRDKIIERRATELIEGDALKWNVSDGNSKTERPDVSGSTSQILVIGSKAAMRGEGERCSLLSPPEPISVLHEFERQRGIKPGAVTGIYEKNAQSIRVVVEPIYDHADPPMIFPLIGKASLHRLRYRCTITLKDVDRTLWPAEAQFDRNAEATIYIDVDHLHRNDREVTAGGAQSGHAAEAGKTSTAASALPAPIQSNPSQATPSDPKSELLAKLQGRWKIQIRSQFPNNEPDAVIDRAFAEIRGNLMMSWSESNNKRENPATILLKLGEPGPPQQIDLIANPNDGEDRTVMPVLSQFRFLDARPFNSSVFGKTLCRAVYFYGR